MDVDTAQLKQTAADRAVECVESGMVLGLGHGTTAIYAIHRIAELLRSGDVVDIVAVPCSLRVENDAGDLGIPLTNLNQHPVIDLTIDGADEVDPDLNLIKGGGGALLREKIVAQASLREIIVADDSKLSPALGRRWPVPVEVTPFGWRTQVTFLESLGARPALRKREDGSPFRTDQGNLILDCDFGPIDDPRALGQELKAHAGIVEHGLFIGLATDVIVACADGYRHLVRDDS